MWERKCWRPVSGYRKPNDRNARRKASDILEAAEDRVKEADIEYGRVALIGRRLQRRTGRQTVNPLALSDSIDLRRSY